MPPGQVEAGGPEAPGLLWRHIWAAGEMRPAHQDMSRLNTESVQRMWGSTEGGFREGGRRVPEGRDTRPDKPDTSEGSSDFPSWGWGAYKTTIKRPGTRNEGFQAGEGWAALGSIK